MRSSDFMRNEDEFVFNQKNQTPKNKSDIKETENLYNYYCKDDLKEKRGNEKQKKKEPIDTIVDDKHKKEKLNTNRPTKSISEVAQEVIKGEWGIGLIRRNKLRNAGYGFNKIQSEVDRILFSN